MAVVSAARIVLLSGSLLGQIKSTLISADATAASILRLTGRVGVWDVPPRPFVLGAYRSLVVWSNSCMALCAGFSMQEQPYSSLERIMGRYSISSVFQSPPHFKNATTRGALRASLHCVFNTLMCFLKEKCASHHSPRNAVESSTGRNVSLILIAGGLATLDRGLVKCMTLHLWAANLKPFLVAHCDPYPETKQEPRWPTKL